MTTSPEISELAAALVKAQSEMDSAKKTSDNPFFKSKYADLAEVWSVVREPLTKNGLCVLQPASGNGDTVTVTTRIMHSSGQWIEEPLSVVLEKTGPQAAGSAITYLRRYGLQAMVGVPAEDDDGEGAEVRGNGGNGKASRHDDSTITGKPAHTLGNRLTTLIADSRLTEEERSRIRSGYRAENIKTDKQRGEFLASWEAKVSERPKNEQEEILY